jgi:4-hydroxy-2-oxoheptanedioate aldolase
MASIGLFVGPADLSASPGHIGAVAHPDGAAAIDNIIGRIFATGKPYGTINGGAANASSQWGCCFVTASADALLLAAAVDCSAKELRE